MPFHKVQVTTITQEFKEGFIEGEIQVFAVGVTQDGETIPLRLGVRGGIPIFTKIEDFLKTLSKELSGPASEYLVREGE